MTNAADMKALTQPAPKPEDYNNLITMAELRISAMEQVKGFALKRLKPNAFTDFNGTPRITADACEHVARLFGVSWRDITIERREARDQHGAYYFYTASAIFSLPNTVDYVEVVGSASARDDLWAKRKDGNGEIYIVPAEEIDEANVMKKAISNMIATGVPRLLGMADLTYEDLDEAGIKQEDVKGVRFKGKGGSAAGKEQAWTANDQERSKELGEMLMRMADNDAGKAEDLLEQFTSFEGRDGKQVPGVRRRDKLSSGRLKVTHEQVKQAHDAWQEDNPMVPYLGWKKEG